VIGAGAVLALLGFIYSLAIHGARASRGLEEEFPGLGDAAWRGAGYVVFGCAIVWIAWALAPAVLAYVRRRAHPGLVDAVVDLGGSNVGRLLYRPTLSLGGTVTWLLDGSRSVTISPGQAIGFMVPGGTPLTMRGDDAMHLWASERPTARPPRDPWWQAPWLVPVAGALSGSLAVAVLAVAVQVRASSGLGDQLIAVVAVPLAGRVACCGSRGDPTLAGVEHLGVRRVTRSLVISDDVYGWMQRVG